VVYLSRRNQLNMIKICWDLPPLTSNVLLKLPLLKGKITVKKSTKEYQDLERNVNFCCDRSVAWTHKNHVFTCKRKCSQLTKVESRGEEWKDICINVSKPQFSIYAYCEDKFRGHNSIMNCKLDTCRVCCVTHDQVTTREYSIENLEKCFKKCAKTFVVNPTREIE
jgi:hypothetical protein